MNFADRLSAAITRIGSAAIVGLDPVVEQLPDALRPAAKTAQAAADALERFSTAVIDAVASLVPAVKINSAFFEAFREAGVAAYYRLIAAAHARGLLVIGDIKRGDIGSTAQRYAQGHLADAGWSELDPASTPDAVTLAGYLGENAVRPFVDAARDSGRGVFVLVRPSDPGADEVHEFGDPARRFYEHMANLVSRWGAAEGLVGQSGYSCVGAVVAAKDPASTAALGAGAARALLLVPGYGAQGGTAESCRPCFTADGRGAVINASRSVIFAYREERYAHRYGGDWRSAIRAAAAEFARDVAVNVQRWPAPPVGNPAAPPPPAAA